MRRRFFPEISRDPHGGDGHPDRRRTGVGRRADCFPNQVHTSPTAGPRISFVCKWTAQIADDWLLAGATRLCRCCWPPNLRAGGKACWSSNSKYH